MIGGTTAEGVSHSDHLLDPSSLIPFVPPDWFSFRNHLLCEPGKHCYNHHICERVESDLQHFKEAEKEGEMRMAPNLDSLNEKLEDASSEEEEFYMYNREKKRMRIMGEERTPEEEEEEEWKLTAEEEKWKLMAEEEDWKLKMRRADEALDLAIEPEETGWLINEGDNYDVKQLLCPPKTKRDFLIKGTGAGTYMEAHLFIIN